MKTHLGSEQRGGGPHSPDDKVQKCGANSLSEGWDIEPWCKKWREAASVRELQNAKDDLKRQAQFDEEKRNKGPGSREAKRLLLIISREFGRSDAASLVPCVC